MDTSGRSNGPPVNIMRCPDCDRRFLVMEHIKSGIINVTGVVEPHFCPFCAAWLKKMRAAPLNIDSLNIKGDLPDGHPENV